MHVWRAIRPSDPLSLSHRRRRAVAGSCDTNGINDNTPIANANTFAMAPPSFGAIITLTPSGDIMAGDR